MVSGGALWLSVQLLDGLGYFFPVTDYPYHASALWLLQIGLMLVGVVWWGYGVQRSAVSHAQSGGSGLVALTAGLTGLAAFAWAGAFWWLSARHIAPEVWATLTGAAAPAHITFDPKANQLLLQGDLEFGTTRALRLQLKTHPNVRILRLESPGGRVKEGLALGVVIRDHGLDTLVTTECSSACVTAFAGGARRLITADTRLGLHSAGGPGATQEGIAQANRDSDTFIANRGVDWRILEKGAAVANDQIWFPQPWILLASGLATHYAHEVLVPNP